jgi:hypothetical protein
MTLPSGKSAQTCEQQDLVRGLSFLWIWCLPAALIIITNIIWHEHRFGATVAGALFVVGTLWIGIACFINGKRCGRVHCKIDGILLPLLGLAGILNLIGVLSFGWDVYLNVLVVIVILSFVPECFGIRYIKNAR